MPISMFLPLFLIHMIICFYGKPQKNVEMIFVQMNLAERVPLLYTLYEADSYHYDRLEAWIAKQEGIGEVVEETSFGGITVQRRPRY